MHKMCLITLTGSDLAYLQTSITVFRSTLVVRTAKYLRPQLHKEDLYLTKENATCTA